MFVDTIEKLEERRLPQRHVQSPKRMRRACAFTKVGPRGRPKASQATLDALVFREAGRCDVAVLQVFETSDIDAPTVHTGDDAIAVAFGAVTKGTVDTMRAGLNILKTLRVTCPVAI